MCVIGVGFYYVGMYAEMSILAAQKQLGINTNCLSYMLNLPLCIYIFIMAKNITPYVINIYVLIYTYIHTNTYMHAYIHTYILNAIFAN